MLKRILSTITLWFIVLGLPFFMGPQGAVWLLAIATFLTQAEFYAIIEKIGFRPHRRLGCLIGFFTILGTWYIPLISGLGTYNAGPDIITLGVIITALTLIRHPSFTEAKRNLMPTLMGLILVPYMLHMYVRVIQHYSNLNLPLTGLLLTLWLVAVGKFTDVGGLLLGKVFGKNKLAPDISPGKTWEGAIGGVLTSALIGALLAYLFNKYTYMPPAFTPVFAFLTAIPVATLSVASDLIESVLKRQATIKDSGTLIPGIGGMFDLMDSLLLSGPAGFLVFKYVLF